MYSDTREKTIAFTSENKKIQATILLHFQSKRWLLVCSFCALLDMEQNSYCSLSVWEYMDLQNQRWSAEPLIEHSGSSSPKLSQALNTAALYYMLVLAFSISHN